jgi:hypothetical protein
MPEAETARRARRDAAEGKSPSTQAGEFVREEIHHVREGKHGARSAKQAIAIGLSKARRAGVDLPPPAKGSRKTRRAAASDRAKGRRRAKASPKRAKASFRRLKRESRRSTSRTALSRQAHRAARSSSAKTRSARAKKAAATRRRNARANR